MEYYSVITRSEVVTLATIRERLRNLKLNERKQTPKATYSVTPFLCKVQNRQIQRDRKQTTGCWRWEGLLPGGRLFFQGDEHFLELNTSGDCTTPRMY